MKSVSTNSTDTDSHALITRSHICRKSVFVLCARVINRHFLGALHFYLIYSRLPYNDPIARAF